MQSFWGFRGFILALAALSLSACASVSSRYGSDRIDQKGQAYYLPKGVMQVKVVEQGGRFDVIISGPFMIADSEARLHADLRKGAVSDNDTVIRVDPQTQLLTTMKVRSVGRAGEIIENIYNAFAPLQSRFEQGASVTVYSGLFEPGEISKASAAASEALNAYVARKCGYGGGAQCAAYRRAGLDQPNQIELSAQAGSLNRPMNADLGKCRRGLCYRPLVPVKIGAKVAGTYVSEDYFMVPDTSTASYYALPSGMFATQEYELLFNQGVLIEVDQTTRSELLGFTSIPPKILKAIVAAPIDAIRGDKVEPPQAAANGQQGGAGDGNFSGPTAVPGCQLQDGLCPGIGFKSMRATMGGPVATQPYSSRTPERGSTPVPPSGPTRRLPVRGDDRVPGGGTGANEGTLPTGD